MAAFRQSVAASFLFKFYLAVTLELRNDIARETVVTDLPPHPDVADDEVYAVFAASRSLLRCDVCFLAL
jgi:hypothetical protein